MDSTHDDGLANFKSVTGITDTSLAIQILEGFEWDVNAAVNSLIDTSDTVERTCADIHTSTNTSTREGSISPIVTGVSNQCDLEMSEQIDLNSSINLIEFTMTLDSADESSTPVVEEICLQDTASIYDLKEIFFKRRSSEILLLATSAEHFADFDLTEEFLVSSLQLNGILGHSNPDDSTILETLHLPRFNSLTVQLALPNVQNEGVSSSGENNVHISLHVSRPSSACPTNGTSTLRHVLLLPLDTSLELFRQKAMSATDINLSSQIWKIPLCSQISTCPTTLQALVDDLNTCRDPKSTISSRTLASYQLSPGRSYSFILDYTDKLKSNSRPLRSRFSKNVASTSSESSQSISCSSISPKNPPYNIREESRRNKFMSKKCKNLSDPILIDDPDSVDFEDDDDIEIIDEEKPNNNEPMILHELINSPCQAIEHFTVVFLQRYCVDGAGYPPSFISSSLEDALNNAFRITRINDRKPFLMYLHSDKSIAVHVFCKQLLCSVEINQFLSSNDISIWPWDVTRESAKENLLRWLEPSLHWLANVIRRTATDHFPLLIMLGKVAGSYQVFYILTGIGSTISTTLESPWSTDDDMLASFPPLETTFRRANQKLSSSSSVVRGTLKADDVTNELWQKFFVYKEMLTPEIDAERQRMERDFVRLEQDEAYQASLRQDKLKIKAKKEEEEDIKRRELLFQCQEERQKADDFERCILSASALPEEPPEPGSSEALEFLKTTDGNSGIATLRFRLPPGISSPPFYAYIPEGDRPVVPSNGMLIHRFRGIDRLSDLKNYMESLGFTVEKFKLLTTYPRIDLTSLPDDSSTLNELKLVPQETLILEQR